MKRGTVGKLLLGGVAATAAGAAAAVARSKLKPSPLIGTWRVLSATVRTEGVEEERVVSSGGYLVFTPEHRVIALVTKPGRKPATNEAEELELARSMVVYTGIFDLAPDHYAFYLEFSSTELNSDERQIRYYKIDGDNLTITTPMHASVVDRGSRTATVLRLERTR
jgi:hypothetical protein